HIRRHGVSGRKGLIGPERIRIIQIVDRQLGDATVRKGLVNREFNAAARAAVFPDDAEGIGACRRDGYRPVIAADRRAALTGNAATHVGLRQDKAQLAEGTARRGQHFFTVVRVEVEHVCAGGWEYEPKAKIERRTLGLIRGNIKPEAAKAGSGKEGVIAEPE